MTPRPDDLADALGWGALAASSLVVGALLGLARPWPDRQVGVVLAFGAGALISAVSFDLAQEGIELGGGDSVALGLAALFLDSEAALPRWFRIHELRDLKDVISQSVVVVLLVAFLGDVLEWEQGSDIAFVGGGIAAVIAAIAFMLRTNRPEDRGP